MCVWYKCTLYYVYVYVVQLNGNIVSSQLRPNNLTVRLRDGSVIRMILAKPSTFDDLKDVHSKLLVAKNSATEDCKCLYVLVHRSDMC